MEDNSEFKNVNLMNGMERKSNIINFKVNELKEIEYDF